MESIEDSNFALMSKDLFKGHNSYLRMKMKGSSMFNSEWIDRIEDTLYELGQIVNNPREVTKTEGAVTPIELAKKVDGESVQHLASHTQYIKDIDEKGDVIPAKILSHYDLDDIHTYENRFIATFIRRLVLFVEKRYEFIKSTVNLDTKDIMYVKNKSIVNGKEVEIETKISVKYESEDDLTKIAKDYIARVEKMRDYITYYYNSKFMKEFRNEKDVRRPILQTNIIRKNPIYHKCYETFLFIERFESLGVSYKIDRNYKVFNEKERKAISYIQASSLLSLESSDDKKPYKKTTKTYKPRILESIDDEMFTYGNILKGPIEFVRVDSAYKEWLHSRIPQDLIKRPNKFEKEYYKDQYDLKHDITMHEKEVDKLLNRIRREIKKWEKLVAKLIKERDLEEARKAELELQRLREYEQSLLEKKRAAIMAAALADKEVMPVKEIEEKQEEVYEYHEDEEDIERLKELEEEPVNEEPAPVEEPVEQPEEVKEEPVQEEVPVVEEQPTEEPAPEVVEEQPVEAEPVVEPAPVEEPQAEEQPVEETKEEPKKQRKPRAKKEKKVEEVQPIEPEPAVEEVTPEVVEEPAPIEPEPVVEEQPVEPEPVVEEVAPVEEPVKEEQPKKVRKPRAKKEKKVEEPTPIEPEPVVEETPVVEKPVEEPAPVEEKVEPKKERKPRKPRAKKEKPVEEVKPEPVVEETPAPVEEPLRVEEPVKEEPKKERKPRAKKAPKKEKKPAEVKPIKKPEPKKAPKAKPVKEERPVIPGTFIVKTFKGYYVNKNKLSDLKADAKIFHDFNLANDIKKAMGGKVIKL